MMAYGAENIQVLEGLDAVRMRPGMYIGSTGSRGLHHMLWEIVDNAVDEAMAGYARSITVTLHRDGSASVMDDGRGVPVDMHPTLGVSGVEVIYTKLHAGGKFNNDSYSYSGGLHGVGASVVNALSSWLTVDVYRDFKHYAMRFESVYDPTLKKIVAGRPVAPLKAAGNTRLRGTLVRFLPDTRVFETSVFNGEAVARRLRELAYLNRGLTITFVDERQSAPAEAVRDASDQLDEGEEQLTLGDAQPEAETHAGTQVFHYEGGIVDYVKYLNADKTALFEEPIYLEGNKDDTVFRVAIQYTDSYTENVFSYVNNIPTAEGGSHETGFRAAYTKVMNDFARRFGALKEKDANLSGDDFREGMTAVMIAMVKSPQFEGQTKGKLGNTEVRPAVEAILTQGLTAYFDDLKHQELAQQLVEKAVRAAHVRDAARKARDMARTKSALEAAPLVGKLSSCTGRKPEVNELFIVEGDSAGGSAKQGRDRRFQAILPLRGKPLNAEKKRLDQVLANEEFRSVITALGTNIDESFSLKGLKYHKVIILSDADQDGAHIRAILLTFFYRYMRELITEGHVYIGMPPLYRVARGNKVEYAYDDAQLRVLTKGAKNYTIQRYKGLGEMNPEQLWSTTMDPQSRKLLQVTIEDAAQVERRVTVLMGDKVEPRREYISQYANFSRQDSFTEISDTMKARDERA
ncbi:MAG: DNA topoisomerase subunit B [Candidatus Limiplasma sp.]|nr:DNA topoisomerase subunit B [Candidatus Limiplasma sp.]MEA5144836.1 DNA topoisomerase subunit B [Candidatus Limiplasma sp.]